VDDEDFVTYVADRLAGLPEVAAVSLGGSRAQGTHRPDSDWDFAIYYRGRFEPQALRDLGWAGEVFEIGGWGGGVFNGCASTGAGPMFTIATWPASIMSWARLRQAGSASSP
jgi:hypothetical protein